MQGIGGTTTRRLDGVVLVFMLIGALFAGRFVAFFSTAAGPAVVVVVAAATLLARLRISADGELAVRSVVPWWRRVSLPTVTAMRLFERVSYGSDLGPRHSRMEYRTLVCELRDARGRRVRFWPGAYDDADGAIRAALLRVARQGATVEGAHLLGALSPQDGAGPPSGG